MNRIKTTLVLAGALALSGCATMKRQPARLDVVSSGQVQITNVSAHREGEEIHVTANLRPISAATSGVGHVDVEFIDAAGAVLETIKAEPNVSQFSRNTNRAPAISARATLTDEEIDLIRLTHHADVGDACDL